MEGKSAIIFGGSAYNIRYSLESLKTNLIEENDCDIFVVTTRACRRRRIDDAFNIEPLTDEEIELIKSTFGARLKAFIIAEENEDYYNSVKDRRIAMMEKANSYIKESKSLNLISPWKGNIIDSPDNGNIRGVIDQYSHIKRAYELMEEYENANNFKYSYVIRARIDCICPEPINIEHYILGQDIPLLFCCGGYSKDFVEWQDETTWFSRRYTASKLFPNLDKMGFITTRAYKTVVEQENNDFIFNAETQFSILLQELGINVFHVPIDIVPNYTEGFLNYQFRRKPTNIEEEYKVVCNSETDINQHLPILREYAEKCDTITELGVRYGQSTIAFMASKPKLLTSYDVGWSTRMDFLNIIAKENNINFKLIIQNPTDTLNNQSLIQLTDLLFIDSIHHEYQCSEELRLHSPKVNKYIIFHDTTTFWEKGESFEEGHGLRYAIEPFLSSNPQWKMIYRTDINNGLMILEK